MVNVNNSDLQAAVNDALHDEIGREFEALCDNLADEMVNGPKVGLKTATERFEDGLNLALRAHVIASKAIVKPE